MGLDPTEGPRDNTGSIGRRRRRGDAHSRAVLIGREAWPYFSFREEREPLFFKRAFFGGPRLPLFSLVVGRIALLILSGGHGGEAIPVPIPNTEVKLSCADDSAFEARK